MKYLFHNNKKIMIKNKKIFYVFYKTYFGTILK